LLFDIAVVKIDVNIVSILNRLILCFNYLKYYYTIST
jgi:hypothetical protein